MSPLQHFAVALLVAFSVCALHAQEAIVSEELFEETTPGAHAGLLGKRFVQATYRHHLLNDDIAELFDDSFQGFDTKLNVPVLKMGQLGPFGADVFAGYTRLTFGGSTFVGPPLNLPMSLHSTGENLYAGTTLYTTAFETFRPFVQLGTSYTEAKASVNIGGFGFTDTDFDTQFKLILGTEADLSKWAAIRFAFDVETRDRFTDSGVSSELIVWPLEKIFLRGGLLTPLSGDSIGGAIGAGVVF